jgi:cholesterol oxidase
MPMASMAEGIRLEDLRYAARLPWLGPIVGALRARGEPMVRIGGASDPLFDQALAAVLVPVVRDRQADRLVPADAEGKPAGIAQVSWAFALDNDRNGHFGIDAPLSLWEGKIDGVLLLLLHDRLPMAVDMAEARLRYFSAIWDDRLARFVKPGDVPVRGGLARTIPIPELPQAMQGHIDLDVGELLDAPIETLEPALIELDRSLLEPPEDPTEITFAVASCQYPAGFLDRDVAERSYGRLARCVERERSGLKPKCLLLIGDQIYADATAGLFDPSTLYDRFEFPYERLLGMAALRRIQRRIPVFMMLDDHEIEDNWEPIAGERRPDANLINGRRFYLEYQRVAGPELRLPTPDSPLPVRYDFELAGFPFFIADTRTERQARSAETIDDARIMSDSQFEDLLDWLGTPRDPEVPKFIASPACLLPRALRSKQNGHRASALRSDAWDGYPGSLHRLLAYIVEKQIGNVVFLSGDEHISFATRARIVARGSGKSMSIHSIHSSALYAPFPFANALPDDLAWEETFRFALPSGELLHDPTKRAAVWGGDYECEVATEFAPPGDGFTLVQALRENGQWAVRCRFSRQRFRPAPYARGRFDRGRMIGARFVPDANAPAAAKWLKLF